MKYREGDCALRPWGTWRVLSVGEGWVVKRLDFTQGGQLSTQRHAKRDEVWTVVAGELDVTIGGYGRTMLPGQRVRIRAGLWHTASSPVGMATIIEVQLGEPDEDDIERRP